MSEIDIPEGMLSPAVRSLIVGILAQLSKKRTSLSEEERYEFAAALGSIVVAWNEIRVAEELSHFMETSEFNADRGNPWLN